MSKITIERSVVEQALEALNATMATHGKREWIEAAKQQADATLRSALEQSQGEQKPVAYYVMNGAALFQLFRSKSQADALAYDLQKRHDLSGSLAHFHVVPLYTHPQPPRQPLTDEAVRKLIPPWAAWKYEVGHDEAIKFARAVEAAHGIGGEK